MNFSFSFRMLDARKAGKGNAGIKKVEKHILFVYFSIALPQDSVKIKPFGIKAEEIFEDIKIHTPQKAKTGGIGKYTNGHIFIIYNKWRGYYNFQTWFLKMIIYIMD